MIHISDIIINLTRKHLNQLNLYNLQFMRIEFNITADVWNLTPNCWKSGSIIFRQGYLICECVFKNTWIWNLGIKPFQFIENLEFIKFESKQIRQFEMRAHTIDNLHYLHYSL